MILSICILVGVAALIIFLSRNQRKVNAEFREELERRLGGNTGWPTELWEQEHRKLLHPHLVRGDTSFPVTGTVAGHPVVSFRCEHSKEKTRPTVTLGLKTTTTTWSYTGAAVLDVDPTVPYLDIFRPGSIWEAGFQGKSIEPLQFPCGDANIEQYFATYSDETARASRLITPAFKSALFDLHNLDPEGQPSPRIRIKDGVLMCWVGGVDTRQGKFSELLELLAALTDAVNAAVRADRRTAG
ncbi:hypothetical protein AB0N05_13105 [Nocardia sp. NPDC051030]|uniref:hypothetical protein n=1 Tax=Nocardia sp. NPDC051030 TaxID=3155162 RepID=UPI003413DBA5